jgi:surface protein
MNNMFSNCIKLSSMPDIDKWNTSNLVEHNFMFHNCPNIGNIPSKFKN